jgi:hypothetical protein
MGNYSKNSVGLTFNNGNSVVIKCGDKMGFAYIQCNICNKDSELWGDATFHFEIGRLKRGQLPCGCAKKPVLTEVQIKILVNRTLVQNKSHYTLGSILYRGSKRETVLQLIGGSPKTPDREVNLANFLRSPKAQDRLVLGHGRATKGVYSFYLDYPTNKKHSREYSVWRSILQRSYCLHSLNRHPTYLGCEVSENFKNFQYFAEWCNNQIGWSEVGWQIDKDILSTGLKIYSEDNCVFVPREINMLMINTDSGSSTLPCGVTIEKGCNKNPYIAQVCNYGKNKIVGYFSTIEEAHIAYLSAKSKYAKELAEKFKGRVDDRVINFLMAV